MTPERFLAAVEALFNGNKSAAARWLARDRVTVWRYCQPVGHPQHSPVPGTVSNLVEHWLKERGISLEE